MRLLVDTWLDRFRVYGTQVASGADAAGLWAALATQGQHGCNVAAGPDGRAPRPGGVGQPGHPAGAGSSIRRVAPVGTIETT